MALYQVPLSISSQCRSPRSYLSQIPYIHRVLNSSYLLPPPQVGLFNPATWSLLFLQSHSAKIFLPHPHTHTHTHTHSLSLSLSLSLSHDNFWSSPSLWSLPNWKWLLPLKSEIPALHVKSMSNLQNILISLVSFNSLTTYFASEKLKPKMIK